MGLTMFIILISAGFYISAYIGKKKLWISSDTHFGLQFVGTILTAVFLCVLGFQFFYYADKQAEINRINMEYDTICVMFLSGEGNRTVRENLEELQKIKASNDTFAYDGFNPDSVDDTYDKYRKLSDEAMLQDMNSRCPAH